MTNTNETINNLTNALAAIANMSVNDGTDTRQALALCIAIANIELGKIQA